MAVVESVSPSSGGLQYYQYSNASLLSPTPLGACSLFYYPPSYQAVSVADNGVYYLGAHQFICTVKSLPSGTLSGGIPINPSVTAGSCPVPASGAPYTYNSTTFQCERPLIVPTCSDTQQLDTVTNTCINPPNPSSCASGSFLNVNTHMCQQLQGSCVTLTLTNGTSTTVCDSLPALVCPAGKIAGSVNGIMMCAGGGSSSSGVTPLPTASAVSAAGTAQQQNQLDAAAASIAAYQNGYAAAIQSGASPASSVVAGQTAAAAASAQLQAQAAGVAAASGGALPSVPSSTSFYTPKFSGGVSGVMTTNFALMKQTPLMGLIQNITPNIQGAASSGCFNIEIWKVGNQQLCISPVVLNFIGICIMLTAAFAARSIIFGG